MNQPKETSKHKCTDNAAHVEVHEAATGGTTHWTEVHCTVCMADLTEEFYPSEEFPKDMMLEKNMKSQWSDSLEKIGVSWPTGKARRLALLALCSKFNTPMSQDDIAKWVSDQGGRYDRQARHLAADGWYIVSGNRRSTRMQYSPKLKRDQLMLVSVEKANPIWLKELQNSRKWAMSEDEWEKKLRVFKEAGRGCAICGRHFAFYDKGHLDIQKPYTIDNIVPNCIECNNWAQAKKLSFDFNPATLVARPILHRPDAEEYSG
jgi:hypothetical protein